MSLQLKIDIIQDSGLQKRFDGVTETDTATRVVQVSGLTTGSSSDASTALTRAMGIVQATFPKFSGYPGSIAKVMGYQAEGLTQSDDAAVVKVLYDTPKHPDPTAQMFVITDDSTIEPDVTEIFPDPANPVPLLIKWQDPNNAQIKMDYVPSVRYESILRRVVMQGIIVAKSMAPYRALLRCVNANPWFGYPRGFWRFDSLRSTSSDGGKTMQVTAAFSSRVDRDWSIYATLRNRNSGRFIAVNGIFVQFLQSRPYKFGIQGDDKPNGIQKYGFYRLADFSIFRPVLAPTL